ncbi:hypothetical protein OEA41_006744 [Lepraria neglecta]|uniref:Uncharacterized protein n=1 Tax=Lepraria neglecta TaxID=209136 RepID=A0AAD9Z8K9_9LECA|nr:hypothetical protein OEA41_006744 [Lepraria neglecta]
MATPIGKAILTILTAINGIMHPVNLLPNEMPNRDFDFLSPATRSEGPQVSMVCVQLALNGYQGLSQAGRRHPQHRRLRRKQRIHRRLQLVGRRRRNRIQWLYGHLGLSENGTESTGYLHSDTYKRMVRREVGWAIWVAPVGNGGIILTNIEVGDGGHKPDCVWLNRDGERDGSKPKGDHNEAAAMQIHMEDLTSFTTDWNTDTNFCCNEPAMIWVSHFDYRIGLYTREQFDNYLPEKKRIHLWTAKNAMQKTGSDIGPRKRPALRARTFEGRLTTSAHKKHSARELCEDENSHGVWPLCKEGEREGECYDVKMTSLVTAKKLVKRKYVQVENWQ